MPEEINKSERRSPVDGHRFIQSITERYGLEYAAGVPNGMRRAFAASSWSVVKSWARRTVPFVAYPIATEVFAGCAVMNCLRSFHCDATSLSSESSIKIAR